MRVVVETGQSGWEIAAAVAAIVAAGATAVAAWAAWKAASASERTSRESRQALAAALRPTLRVVFGNEPDPDDNQRLRLFVAVQNITEWDAKDVDVEVSYTNRETERDRREHLGSRIRDVNEEIKLAVRPEIQQEHAHRQIARVTVRWSDAQRISRYQLRFEPHPDGGWREQLEPISGP